jgi:uncharacterized glyoxalase superfamily metalloenzyme YdcJ
MCDRPVELALAASLTQKHHEVEQLREDLAATRLQLAVAMTAWPRLSPSTTWADLEHTARRARAFLASPRTPLVHLPHPRTPEDDRVRG